MTKTNTNSNDKKASKNTSNETKHKHKQTMGPRPRKQRCAKKKQINNRTYNAKQRALLDKAKLKKESNQPLTEEEIKAEENHKKANLSKQNSYKRKKKETAALIASGDEGAIKKMKRIEKNEMNVIEEVERKRKLKIRK